MNELDTAQPPVATPDNYTVVVDTQLFIDAPGVLGNDTDANNEPITAVLVQDVAHGNLSLNSDGSFTYTPQNGFEGTDSFTYYADDGLQQSPATTVTLGVVTTALKVNQFGTVIGIVPEVYVDGQLSNGTHTVYGSRTIEITGNGWFMVDLSNVNITADTVLSFDFQSETEAEIQGIGFDNDLSDLNPQHTVQIWGTQNWADFNLDNYGASSPTEKHYEVPVGSYFTGDFRYLIFVQDDDANENAVSRYSNVRLYVPSAGTIWADAVGIDPLTSAPMAADSNNDGKPNYFHFATATDPMGLGVNEGKSAMSAEEEEAEYHLTITVPIRLGATFSGTPLTSAPIDGVIYTILGDSDLGAPFGDMSVEEVTPALTSGLPALDDLDDIPGADWEYRTFRLINPVADNAPGFMWISVKEAP